MEEVLKQIDFLLKDAKDRQSNAVNKEVESFYRGKVAALMESYILIKRRGYEN